MAMWMDVEVVVITSGLPPVPASVDCGELAVGTRANSHREDERTLGLCSET